MKNRIKKINIGNVIVILIILYVIIGRPLIKRYNENKFPELETAFLCPTVSYDNSPSGTRYNEKYQQKFLVDILVGKTYEMETTKYYSDPIVSKLDVDTIMCDGKIAVFSKGASEKKDYDQQFEYFSNNYDIETYSTVIDNIDIKVMYTLKQVYDYNRDYTLEGMYDLNQILTFGYFEKDGFYYYIQTEYYFDIEERLDQKELQKALEKRYKVLLALIYYPDEVLDYSQFR